MKGRQDFLALSPYHQALVSIAVLVDGLEASKFVESDAQAGQELGQAAEYLASQKPQLRLPYLGTHLRKALHQLEREKRKGQ